jgi:Flp pilus assembly protein TadD
MALGLLGPLALAQPVTAPSMPQPATSTGTQSDINSITTAIVQAQRLLAAAQYSEAIQTLDGALKTAPRDPRLRFTYGLVLSEQGKSVEALDVFTQLTQDFPELPEPFNNLAVLYASRGELERAKLALDNALRALPTYSVAHENLGDIYLRMAMRAYAQAQSNDRANTTAQTKLTMTRELLSKVAPSAPTPAATTKP